MTPFSLTEDLILASDANRLLITNQEAKGKLTIYLPPAYDYKIFEILLLSEYKVVISTNSETSKFLTKPPKSKLIVGGSYASVGRSITITSYDNSWRIIATSLQESQIIFEE
jgi:hypothetical protein